MTQKNYPTNCQEAIIRIFSADGEYFGTGVLAISGLVVTCAHVVCMAVGQNEDRVNIPDVKGRIKVDFPFLPDSSVPFNNRQAYDVDLADGGWGPANGWKPNNDIAVLKLLGTPPFEDGYRFNNKIIDSEQSASFYGFTRDNLAGGLVSGTLQETITALGVQNFDTKDHAYTVRHGCSGASIFEKTSGGASLIQGMVIGNNDEHSMLKGREKERIAYIIPAARIYDLVNSVSQNRKSSGEIEELAGLEQLLKLARCKTEELRGTVNSAEQFARLSFLCFDKIEQLSKQGDLSPECWHTVMDNIYRAQQTIESRGYDRYLSLVPFGDLSPKLHSLMKKIEKVYPEGCEQDQIENDILDEKLAHKKELEDLQEEIETRLSYLRNKAGNLNEEKKKRAIGILEKLEFELLQEFICLTVIDNIRQTLQELDKTDIFAELVICIQLFMGKNTHRLKPGMVFRDSRHSPEMVMIPSGSFMMGSPDDDEGRDNDEGPHHLVSINDSFAVSRFTITFEEWDAFVQDSGYEHKPDDRGWGRGRHPVINVSWDDAQAYIKWLNEKAGQQYRLLSEAEWEYCCRTGTKTRYWWGDDITQDQANYNRNIGKTVPVDHYKPNPWGLYQMHGNVEEWCQDEWHNNYEGVPTDGSARVSSSANEVGGRVLRGGSWVIIPRNLRSAFRGDILPTIRVSYVGFRISRTSFTP